MLTTHRSRRLGLASLTLVLVAGLAILALSSDRTEATGPPPSYTLYAVANNVDAGIVVPSSGSYSSGSIVPIEAIPNTGWEFDHWEVHLTGSINPTTITMDSNKAVVAFFKPSGHYTLTASSSNPAHGSVDPAWSSHAPGTQAQVHAYPASGYRFLGWSGTPFFFSLDNPATVMMNSNRSITAVFQQTYILSTSVVGTGSVDPASGTYDSGAVVTLSANPGPGWRFSHWSGSATGTSNPVNVTMNANKNVMANFIKTWALSTTIAPTGGGSISPGAGIYDTGTPLTLTATPAVGYRFSHWSGDASGSENPVAITMNGNLSLTANFVAQYTLTSSVIGEGSISPTEGTFDSGTPVSLTATPANGWRFVQWSGDATGTANPLTVSMNGNKNIIATFEPLLFTLDLEVNGNGNVMKYPDYPAYFPGTVVTITAIDGLESLFDHWRGSVTPADDTAAPILQVTMNGDKSFTAWFVDRPGLSAIDMLSDLEDFLTLIGASDTIATWDRNDIVYDENFERVYVGDGMPDAMELYLLERILKTRRLGLSWRGGVAHDAIWDIWAANLAQAQADLPSQPGYVQRIVAAYMTHGTFESGASVQDLVATHFGASIDPMDYQNKGRRYLAADKDADNDGLSNRSEWEHAAPTGDLADKDAFVAGALDGVKAAGAGSGGGGAGHAKRMRQRGVP